MRTVTTRSALLALSLSLVGTAGLVACSSGGGSDNGPKSYADGKTFAFAMNSDPGALDPQQSLTGNLTQLTQFAYDSLLSVAADTGEIQSQLADSWKVDGKTITLEIRDGVTCSDGSPFDAQTVVDNLTYLSDEANKSPFLGLYYPAGSTATASGSTVTIKVGVTGPFVLNALAKVPMVCEAGLKDRSTLTDGTSGTGPYVLESSVPGSKYVYKVREGYTWGPDGASTATKGMPAQIDATVVLNETTAANGLLTGTLNAATIKGPDAERLDKAGVASADLPIILGEQWYNHAEGHLTSDPAVRMALTQGIDYTQLADVLTAGKGIPTTQLAPMPPIACQGTTTGAVPAFDAKAAEALLDEAGWVKGSDGIRTKDGKKLELSLLVDNFAGNPAAAASELAVENWKAIGIKVNAKLLSTSQLSEPLFTTGDWDIAWETVGVNSPDQMVPFLSGDTANNFSHIDNADYEAKVEAANAKVGSESCPDWLAAEESLFAAADLVPFAGSSNPTFLKGAELTTGAILVPSAIRMLG